jgi:hypothetical protein
MILAFLAPDERAIAAPLTKFTIAFEFPGKLAADLLVSQPTRIGIRLAASPTLKIFRDNGVFQDPRVRNAFETRGLELTSGGG